MRTHVQAVAVLSLIAAISARAQTTRKDTIDVSVGSALVDFSKHVPGSTLAHQQWSMGGNSRTAPVMRWNFSYADTGATPLLLVHPTAADPSAPTPPLPVYVFNRKTLALLRVLDPNTSAAQLTIDATKVTGHVVGPNGAVPIDVTLSEPAYFCPLADLVTESLPRRVGAVYRVPLWGPPSPAVETHLYSFVRREDITVLGKTYRNAWVVEDRAADGTRLNGTMWLVDGAPELVRWIINQPNGAHLVGPGAAPAPLMVRESMQSLEARLERGTFRRVHRSAIVNSRQIREVQPWFRGDYVIILRRGARIVSGRTYRDDVRALLESRD